MMGRHLDEAVQISINSACDDLDLLTPSILDELEESLLKNLDKSLGSLKKTLKSLHPVDRLYFAVQLPSTLFVGTQYEYLSGKLELELIELKADAVSFLISQGLTHANIQELLSKVPHSVWHKLSSNSEQQKISWQGTANQLAALINDLIEKSFINLQQIPRSQVCALFASIFNDKDGKAVKPDTLADYIVQFNNCSKETPSL